VIPVGQVLGAFLIQASGVRFEYSVAAAGLLVSGIFFVLSKDMRSLRYVRPGVPHGRAERRRRNEAIHGQNPSA
jgi:hypothetical protein